jgi:hypothetical protein
LSSLKKEDPIRLLKKQEVVTQILEVSQVKQMMGNEEVKN